jgi:AAA domain
VEGSGKTSFAANAPKPVFLMSKGETGLETLIDSGRLPEVPHFPEIQVWGDLLSAIEWLTGSEHDYRTVVLDTLNGFERLCFEFVCDREYGGDWGKKGFASYQQGADVSTSEWRLLLNALDTLREKKRMAVIGLCHTRVSTFKNPAGADFDRYTPAMHTKLWELTHRWADHVCFVNFYTEVVTDGRPSDAPKKGKGKGGQDRVMYTERHAAYDAKNRAGLPEEVDMGDSGAEAWANFLAAMKSGKAAQ